MIASLINKQDTFEIVRDQIAAILAIEFANQQALAAAQPDPSLWAARVYIERSNPWGELDENNKTPIVNVMFDRSNPDGLASDTVQRQKMSGLFNVDCYGYGQSADDGSTGHTPGDLVAALAVQRTLRLVRNILMAAEYTYLGLRGTVSKRWPESVTMMQPNQAEQNAEHVVGARLALRVDYNEFSPQVEPQTLDLLSVAVTRSLDGQVLLNADYDYT